MNKPRPFFLTIKIRKWSYCFLSAGILLLFVLPPSVAQMSQQDWDQRQRDYEDKRRRDEQEEEERYWHKQRMQQPLRSVKEEAKVCFDDLIRSIPNAQAWGMSGLISASCTAVAKGDFNTAWINMKRMGAVYRSKNFYRNGEAGHKELLDGMAAVMINNFGWTPPEYR